MAEVHQLEETDSGHSSSYEGAGPSPVMAVENNDYLIPVVPDSPPPSPPHTASQQRADIVPPIPAPPEGPKISLAAKLPPLRQAPSSSSTSRFRQPAPLRLYPTTSTTAPSPMFQAAASTAPLTRSAPQPQGPTKKSEDGESSAPPEHKKRGSEGFVPNSWSPTTSPTNSEAASGAKPTLGSGLKPNGGVVPPSSSSLSWANKRAGIPKMKDTSRVYSSAGASADSGPNAVSPVSPAPSSSSPTVPTLSTPLTKYTAWPLPPLETSEDNVNDPSHTLSNGPLRTRIGNFRNGLNEGRFLSNASSGYNSDLSPAESTPPPDYRAVLDEATETDILV